MRFLTMWTDPSYETQSSWGSSTTNAYPLPFNQPFFILMNMAVGGNYGEVQMAALFSQPKCRWITSGFSPRPARCKFP